MFCGKNNANYIFQWMMTNRNEVFLVKVLVMGDCHLKSWMFKRAEDLMQKYEIDTWYLLEIW